MIAIPSSSYMNIDGMLDGECGERYSSIIHDIICADGQSLDEVLQKYMADDTWEQV